MFDILKKYGMKLNLKKCAFSISSGKFLSYMVNNRGIEANLENIRAIIGMKAPSRPREVQSLMGRIAALSWFVLKSTDWCKPFFDTLRGEKKFKWTSECQDAFDELKKQLAQPPILKLYLVVTKHAISAVLIREEDEIQYPVYYTSKVLHDADLRYSPLEKLAYALIMATWKLRPYYLEHSVEFLTNSPLRQTL